MNNDSHVRHIGAYIWLLAALLVTLALFYIFGLGHTDRAKVAQMQAKNAAANAQQLHAVLPSGAPAPTAGDMATEQTGFQYLVQYTDTGLHPAALSMSVGQTVRFTNNSASTVTISIASTKSPALSPGAYWQYTASTAGTASVSAASSSMSISIQ